MRAQVRRLVLNAVSDWLGGSALTVAGLGTLGFGVFALLYCGTLSSVTPGAGLCGAVVPCILSWRVIVPVAAMFLPGMWVWKAWRYGTHKGSDAANAPLAGLFCIPWLSLCVVFLLLIVVAVVISELVVNGEAWANLVAWRLTRIKRHEDETGILYVGMTSWGPVDKVRVTDAHGEHCLTVKTASTAREAVASTFGLKPDEYAPAFQL